MHLCAVFIQFVQMYTRHLHQISKNLIQYVPPPPVKKNTASTSITGSRVLTSAEGYALLHEKEKKKEKEEKDQ